MSTRVLYIAGTGRSGSTLLANLLGEVDGVFAAGEVRYLWQRGLVENRRCGCGLAVRECPVWTAVLDRSGWSGAPAETEVMLRLLAESTRLRHLPLMLAGRLDRRLDPVRSHAPSTQLAKVGRLYDAMAEATGSRVVVDSSKLPAYANLLAPVPGIDLRVVQLVRDPRGAAFSWASRKRLGDGAARTEMEQIGPAKSAALWDVWNTTTRVLFGGDPERYMRLRYEDLVADPDGAVGRVLALAGEPASAAPAIDGGEVRLGVNHMVAGNPDRLRAGTVQVRPDERWRTGMSRRDLGLVSLATAPLLRSYGYELRPATSQEGGQETIFERARPDESAAQRLQRRVRRHVRWGRTEGIGRLIEEDQLNPAEQARTALTKWRWRRGHAVAPGTAMPVFLVGLQRSGTNMLARGIDASPEFEVRNENDREAFDRFLLRSDDVVRRIVLRSRHQYVLFKPLCDSHRVDQLLDGLGTPTAGRAIWAYRDVDGRVRSALSKYGRNNLLVLRDIAAGRGAAMWQAQRLSAASLEVLRSFDLDAMSPASAAALFWWLRNGLYFELGLDERADVALASYRDLLDDPGTAMRSLCRFLDLEYSDRLIEHIGARGAATRALDLDPRVRALCDQLQARLDDSLRRQRRQQAA